MTSLPAPSVPETLLPPGRWVLDGASSAARFRIRHLGFATVRGRFGALSGAVVVAADGSFEAEGAVEVASIDTGDDTRDGRLRGEGFFDAERFPRIVFAAVHAAPRGLGAWTVDGELTMAGEAHPLSFLAWRPVVEDDTFVLRAEASLSRRAHGLDWPGLRQAGRAVVGDNVGIDLELVGRRA